MSKKTTQVRVDEQTMKILAKVREVHGINYITAVRMAVVEKYGEVLKVR